jgi:hypothetical protein
VVLGLLAAAALAFLLASWIVTDREAIERLLVDTAAHAERGEWHAVREALDEDFEGEGRDAFLARARTLAASAPARGWRLVVEEIQVEGDEATARARIDLAAAALLRGGGASVGGRVGLVRRDDRVGHPLRRRGRPPLVPLTAEGPTAGPGRRALVPTGAADAQTE